MANRKKSLRYHGPKAQPFAQPWATPRDTSQRSKPASGPTGQPLAAHRRRTVGPLGRNDPWAAESPGRCPGLGELRPFQGGRFGAGLRHWERGAFSRHVACRFGGGAAKMPPVPARLDAAQALHERKPAAPVYTCELTPREGRGRMRCESPMDRAGVQDRLVNPSRRWQNVTPNHRLRSSQRNPASASLPECQNQ